MLIWLYSPLIPPWLPDILFNFPSSFAVSYSSIYLWHWYSSRSNLLPTPHPIYSFWVVSFKPMASIESIFQWLSPDSTFEFPTGLSCVSRTKPLSPQFCLSLPCQMNITTIHQLSKSETWKVSRKPPPLSPLITKTCQFCFLSIFS